MITWCASNSDQPLKDFLRSDQYIAVQPLMRLHALFYRTQDPHRTQVAGLHAGPGPDLNILIFQGEIPSAAHCRHCQMTSIWNFLLLHGSMCASLQAQFSESSLSQLCGELRVDMQCHGYQHRCKYRPKATVNPLYLSSLNIISLSLNIALIVKFWWLFSMNI